MREKTYKFSMEGYNKLKKDIHDEKVNRYISIGIWSIIGILVIGGTISEYGLLKMICCSGTSKTVKFLIHR